MRHYLRYVLALFAAAPALGQPLRLSQTSLNFGTVTEASRGLQTITLSNPRQMEMGVDSVVQLPHIGVGLGQSLPLGPALSVQLSSPQIPALGTVGLVVGTQLRHNLPLQTQVIVCSGQLPGCMAVDVQADVRYRKGYYAATAGLSGNRLRRQLKAITGQGYRSLGYNSGARDAMFMTIDNKRVNGQGATVNTLECVYTGRLTTGYANRQAAQSNNFNTEHTFPQSFFNSDEPMVSDLNHLFPTDNLANNRRNNFPFDTVMSAVTYDSAGSKLGSNNGRIVFEPRTIHKGRTARAMCYMVTRYQDYNGFFAPQEQVLRRWALTYLPDSIELRRQADVLTAQGNRNPYADYPQFLERIPSLTDTNVSTAVYQARLYPSTLSLAPGDTQRMYLVMANAGNQPVSYTAPQVAGFTLLGSNGSGSLAGGQAAQLVYVPGPGLGAGSYTFRYSLSFGGLGSSVQALVLVAPTATRPALARQVLKVWPQPAHGSLRVEGATGRLSLFSIQGQVVATTKQAESLNLHGVAPGIILLRDEAGHTAKVAVE